MKKIRIVIQQKRGNLQIFTDGKPVEILLADFDDEMPIKETPCITWEGETVAVHRIKVAMLPEKVAEIFTKANKQIKQDKIAVQGIER
jgi:hypothetical protein